MAGIQSLEEAKQRKANFVTTNDRIKKHNSLANVNYQLAHNQFSVMVRV